MITGTAENLKRSGDVPQAGGGTAVDWQLVRAEFPALANWTYLNTATYGQMPRRATAAMQCHLARREETACSDFLAWFDDMDSIRGLCARLLNCEAPDIAFVVNAATGLSTLIQGLAWEPGDEVLTLQGEFPNQLYLSAVLKRFGATLRSVEWSRFYSSINESTRLVVLSTVNYATGWRLPLEQISHHLRERGVLLYLDGSQSVGALSFDVQTVRPAALCVDAYKWMLSPNGASFLYVDPELRRRLPAGVVGWRSDRGWRSVDFMNHGDPVFAGSAEKYEGGMLAFPSLYAMGAVIELMLEIGPRVIEARVLELAEMSRAMLRSLGADVSAGESPIVTAAFPGRAAADLVSILRERRILVSARHGRLRVSPHFYNDEADLRMMKDCLARSIA